MSDQDTRVIECSPCLTYRALPKGHPYMIKYHASVSFHTPIVPIDPTAPDAPGCAVTNLCERHAPKNQAGLTVTPPGQTCGLGEQCEAAHQPPRHTHDAEKADNA